MITKNFEDYPEHRLKFFSLLRAIAAHCFPALIRLSSQVCVLFIFFVSHFVAGYIQIYMFYHHVLSFDCFCIFGLLQQLKLVMDSIIWAFRHTERNIAETGLNLLLEMLKNFQVC